MLLSVESPFAGAFAVGIGQGPRCYSVMVWCQAVLPASDENMCKRTIGVPQELVQILSFPRQHPGWRYRVSNSRLSAAHSSVEERTATSATDEYHQAKETKRGGMRTSRKS